MKEFSHGGDVDSFAKRLGIKKNEVIDLSSNINFIKPKIKKDFNSLSISSYPNYDKLYKVLSKRYKVKNSQLEIFNGATSAIFSLFNSLDFDKVYIFSPAYLEYKRACRVFGKEVVLVNRFEKIDADISPNSLVIFVNPSTPDGKFYDIKRLLEISKRAKVLVDESFLEFCKNCESATKFLKSHDNLYILKSLTKFYSSAGIRLGIIISSKKNIKSIKQKEPLWKISEFDKNYILEALKDKKFIKKTQKKIAKNREFYTKKLLKLKEVEEVYPSSANYLLLRLNISAKEFQKRVEKSFIMIRDCSNFDFLDDRFVRIAVKKKSYLKALK